MKNSLLISKFMGVKDNNLPYNKSWNCLMPVIKKCNEKGIYLSDFTNHLYDSLIAVDINGCFNAVVGYIKLYNSKKVK